MTADLPHVLLLDDGELTDVRSVLDQLDIPWTDGVGDLPVPTDSPEGSEVPLLVTTVERARNLRKPGAEPPAHHLHLVVADARSDDADPWGGVPCDFVLRRPIERTVLALLARRAGYEGPERRRVSRVAIGAPVVLTIDGADRDAVLAQLSIRGCGLIIGRALEPGQSVDVVLPDELTASRPLDHLGNLESGEDGRVVERLRQGEPERELIFDEERIGVGIDFHPNIGTGLIAPPLEFLEGDRVRLRVYVASGQLVELEPRSEVLAAKSGARLASGERVGGQEGARVAGGAVELRPDLRPRGSDLLASVTLVEPRLAERKVSRHAQLERFGERQNRRFRLRGNRRRLGARRFARPEAHGPPHQAEHHAPPNSGDTWSGRQHACHPAPTARSDGSSLRHTPRMLS